MWTDNWECPYIYEMYWPLVKETLWKKKRETLWTLINKYTKITLSCHIILNSWVTNKIMKKNTDALKINALASL